jgi:hypothetical protein
LLGVFSTTVTRVTAGSDLVAIVVAVVVYRIDLGRDLAMCVVVKRGIRCVAVDAVTGAL